MNDISIIKGDSGVTGMHILLVVTVVALVPLVIISLRVLSHGVEMGDDSLVATGGFLLVFVVTVVLVLIGLRIWKPGE